MKKSTVSYLLIYILLASITLTASVLAWVTLSKETNTGVIGSDIPDFTNMVEFEVKRSGETEYRVIKTIDDMHAVFGNTSPGETYEFKIVIDNLLSRAISINLFLPNFSSTINTNYVEDDGNDINEYNILEVFYIKNGTINTKIVHKTSGSEISDNNSDLDRKVQDVATAHGQVLNKFRIANLINDSNSINLVSANIPINTIATITFTLVYDAQTEDNTYQNLVLGFDGIYIYSEQVA